MESEVEDDRAKDCVKVVLDASPTENPAVVGNHRSRNSDRTNMRMAIIGQVNEMRELP